MFWFCPGDGPSDKANSEFLGRLPLSSILPCDDPLRGSVWVLHGSVRLLSLSHGKNIRIQLSHRTTHLALHRFGTPYALLMVGSMQAHHLPTYGRLPLECTAATPAPPCRAQAAVDHSGEQPTPCMRRARVLELMLGAGSDCHTIPGPESAAPAFLDDDDKSLACPAPCIS
jgi:hypothetical protein